MAKMHRPKWTSIIAGPALAALTAIGSVEAADCPRSDTLGTSRVLSVDAKTTPRVGLKSFPQTLPLADHEVVLTFDDGPRPPMTSRSWRRWRRNACAQPSSWSAGAPPNILIWSSASPARVTRSATTPYRIRTWRIPADAAKYEIDRGIATDEMALHGVSTTTPSTPFFRFPISSPRQPSSICSSRAASSCSAPISGPATGTT